MRRLTLLSCLLLAPVANAGSHFEPGIAISSDRIWRGLSQTRGRPALIAETKWKDDSGAFLGLWGSNLSYDGVRGTSIEALPFAGYATRIEDAQLELGVLYHWRPARDRDLDYAEFSVVLTQKFGPLSVTGGSFASPSTYLGGASLYPYLDLRLGLGTVAGVRLAATAHAGTYRFTKSAIDDYADWRVGLAGSGYGLSMHAAFSRSDVDPRSPLPGSDRGGGRFSVSVTRMF